MPALSLVGPSNQLRALKSDAQRTVNWMPTQIESGTGKGGSAGYLKQIPGLRLLGNFGGPARGLKTARGQLYGVFGNTLKLISSAWTGTGKGAIGTSSGPVDMAANETQLCVVDGGGYVLDLDTSAFTSLSSPFPGSVRIGVLDGYGIASAAGTRQFSISGAEDFTSWDGLDFATAEGSTGSIIGFIVKHREILFLKELTGEVWNDVGGADFPLARNDGANIEVGCCAPQSLQKIGGVAFWLGRDENGTGVVFSMQAYSPQRISTHPLEEKLSGIEDLSGSTAFVWHIEGSSHYALNVPGLETTWCYDIAAGIWWEAAEWVGGAYQPWRVTCHAMAYGMHVVGDSSGNLYELDPTYSTNNGDPIIRDRITPHSAMPGMQRTRYGSIQIDCTVGDGLVSGLAAKLMLRYSNDGGRTWSNWRYLTLGSVGQYLARARATMLGVGRDRVWHIRVTDDVRCDVLSAVVNES